VIGEWARDKLTGYCCSPATATPTFGDFGSAAKHHRCNAWLCKDIAAPACCGLRCAVGGDGKLSAAGTRDQALLRAEGVPTCRWGSTSSRYP